MSTNSQGSARRDADKRDPGRRAWRAMLVLQGSLLPLLEEEIREAAQLDLQTYDTLLHTYEAGEDGIRMTELAQTIVLSKSGLTSLVDRLEDRGLLQRIQDPDDRRAIRIVLTDQGMETFRLAAKHHMSGIQRHFTDRLTEEEAVAVAEILERIHQEARALDPSD